MKQSKTLIEEEDFTLAYLLSLTASYAPDDVVIEYAGCGSHAVLVSVAIETPEPQTPQRPTKEDRRPGEPF